MVKTNKNYSTPHFSQNSHRFIMVLSTGEFIQINSLNVMCFIHIISSRTYVSKQSFLFLYLSVRWKTFSIIAENHHRLYKKMKYTLYVVLRFEKLSFSPSCNQQQKNLMQQQISKRIEKKKLDELKQDLVLNLFLSHSLTLCLSSLCLSVSLLSLSLCVSSLPLSLLSLSLFLSL